MVEIRVPSVSIPNLGKLPELSESFRNKLQSWEDLGIIRSNYRAGNKQVRRRGTSSASNVLHRMSLPVGNWLGGKNEKKSTQSVDRRNTQSRPKIPPQNMEMLQPRAENRPIRLEKPSHMTSQSQSKIQIDEEHKELRQQRKSRSKCCLFSLCS